MGDRACSDVRVVDTRTLTCTVPPGIGQNRDVRVRNSAGRRSPRADIFDYDGPVVVRVIPSHGLLAPTNTSVREIFEVIGRNLWSGDERDLPPIV